MKPKAGLPQTVRLSEWLGVALVCLQNALCSSVLLAGQYLLGVVSTTLASGFIYATPSDSFSVIGQFGNTFDCVAQLAF